ncbi:MAG: DUF523 domain-containing protein [Methylococcales bacterium]|jgi:uncharacterized protein YbbK (DUF523 family)|nr:DUF523 domain-containing protein [Methylococcales bacterium]MBT7443188.1 DUF523 domain-containing protein [Methylococcales bacterium]
MIIGISACLLGDKVRYDGGDQQNPHVLRLARHYETRKICPEVNIGLGVPRPPIQLIDDLRFPTAIGKHDPSLNPSDALRTLGKTVATTWPGLSGFIVKSRSPSCGNGSTKVIINGEDIRTGTGLFTEQLKRNSQIPVIEETNLDSPASYTQFIMRVEHYYQQHYISKHGDNYE